METPTPPIAHLSFSALMCFMRNKHEFKRTYMDKQYRDVNTPAIVVGKAFHKCMEMYYNGHSREQALEIGFHYIHDIQSQGKMDFGKTGSIEKVLEDYRKTVEHYFKDGEKFIIREAVKSSELSMKSLVEGIPVPIKAVADLVMRSPENPSLFEIVDFKKVTTLTDTQREYQLEDGSYEIRPWVKPEYMIQAAFNFWASTSQLGSTPCKMHFLEVKTSKNQDKDEPQCQLITIDFTAKENLDYLKVVAKLIRDMMALLENKDIYDHLFLPNVSDMFSGEESWTEWFTTQKV